MFKDFVNNITENAKITIKEKEYIVKTKTFYTIEEDKEVSYVKCELSDGKCLVIIPDDELIYVGEVIPNLEYNRIEKDRLEYKGVVFNKTGEGHQFITNIEFGSENEVEGKCIFEDFESEKNIISLGILTDKNDKKADVYAEILNMNDIKIK